MPIKVNDLTGKKFGKLTAIRIVGSRDQCKLWLCQCDCGRETFQKATMLKIGHVKSCGCLRNTLNKDFTGSRFGRLKVIGFSHSGKYGRHWTCKCNCGNTTTISTNQLIFSTRSCGCLQREITGNRHRKHGMYKTPEYECWEMMIQRCINKKCSMYKNYGGRGIGVCKEWLNFSNFISDMGLRPSQKHSINRINNNGNYELKNCEWATRKDQSRNTRRNVMLTGFGRTQCRKDWAIEYGLSDITLKHRMEMMGLSLEEAVRWPHRRRKP